MKHTTYITLAGMVLAAAVCTAQSGSLGDYARAARKENKTVTATKVFDNDNIPKDSNLSVVGNAPDASADTTVATATAPKDGAPAANSQASNAAKVDEIKGRVNDAKSKLELASRELDVTQREYRLRAASFYADAGDRLRNSASWDKEDADYKKKIADQQKAVDDNKKQLDGLQEELRKAGGK
jgi:hypothetical protein